VNQVGNSYRVVIAASAARLERKWEPDLPGQRAPKGGGGSNAGRPGPSTAGRQVTTWSAESRRNLRWALSSIPWEEVGRRPAMVTLTYPGNWQELAPNGPVVARQFRALQERWYRRWGERMRGVWIREFQTRGAPHFHMYVGLPEGLDADEYKALVRRTIRRKQAERTKGKFEARRVAGYMTGQFGRWLLKAWNEILKGGPLHAKRGADVAPMFWDATVQEAEAGRVNWAKISNYLWRESGKRGQKTAPDGFVPPGRSWGMLVVRPRASETELEAAVAMEARRVMYGIYRGQAKRDQERRGKRGKIRKPYRGRDGLVVFGLDREESRRIILWAMEQAVVKAEVRVSGER